MIHTAASVHPDTNNHFTTNTVFCPLSCGEVEEGYWTLSQFNEYTQGTGNPPIMHLLYRGNHYSPLLPASSADLSVHLPGPISDISEYTDDHAQARHKKEPSALTKLARQAVSRMELQRYERDE